jgi:hypothetical protein
LALLPFGWLPGYSSLPAVSSHNYTLPQRNTEMAKPDTLDYTVQFLAKRDGIDKTLKIIRYSTRLLLASGVLDDSQTDLAKKLGKFESSIGTSRQAAVAAASALAPSLCPLCHVARLRRPGN